MQNIASKRGLQLTTSGKVSISAKVTSDTFQQVFGFLPAGIAPTPPGKFDFGAPGGYASEQEITVPPELAEYVESISILPPAQRHR